jgi:phage regulator Rha-like protein
MVPQLTGKDHKNVLRDIANVLEEAGIGQLKFESSYLSEQNKKVVCFNLPRLNVISLYRVTLLNIGWQLLTDG